ncbi:MAG: hypothetical protein P4L91_09960 [Burkholderiaceae bacterium]|nr:hypothetical protein [Burkholderiaceae bacterium]
MVDYTGYIAAIGALGTAAYGVVDASKLFLGGPSNHGFNFISALVEKLFPDQGPLGSGLSRDDLVDTLRANWINGVALDDQKGKAKSLVKLMLDEKTAPTLAAITGVDKTALSAFANYVPGDSAALDPKQKDAYGRFDLALTALFDQAYQRADQMYRNCTKGWAMAVAVILAVLGDWDLISQADPAKHFSDFALSPNIFAAILVGIVATPLAPVAKDLSSAVTSAIQAFQSIKK